LSWQINLVSNKAYYEFRGEGYETEDLAINDRKKWSEEGGGYKEPGDSVEKAIYAADSEHGIFRWEVTARRSGFNTYADIEEVCLVDSPKDCEVTDYPRFEIVES